MDELSESDLTILQMTADGYRLEDIAPVVKFTAGTVRQYRKRLIHLLGAENMNNAIARALRSKLIR